MNAPFNLRQLAQYPRQSAMPAGSVALIQLGEPGSPYGSILASDFVATALAGGGTLNLNGTVGGSIQWSASGSGGPVTLSAVNGDLLVEAGIVASSVSATFVDAVSLTQGGIPVVTQADLAVARAQSVTSFNLRTGDVMLMPEDILRAGGAPVRDAHFGGWITAPSVWDTRANDDAVATANWVHRAIHDTGVSSFNGRTGDIVLTTADINAATAAGPGYPTAPSPVLGDASNRIATTLFVDESLQDLHLTISNEQLALLTSTYAPLNSPQLTGIPTAPTANPGTSTGQLATTSFVMHAVTAGTSGVSSFNTRTGAVVLNTADISSAGGALLASPVFSGNPTAPTAAPGTGNTQLATTAFVAAAVTAAGGVTSFNTRVGAVTLTLADVTGTNVLANTPLTGVPTAPTAAPGTSTIQIATTAFVAASAAAGVTSFMSRTGAVTLTAADVSAAGGALNASPAFTGTPTAPTAVPGTNTTQLATTAFVTAALAATGVTTFNGRSGAVTLTLADVTGTNVLNNTPLTGVPTAPTATAGTSTTQLATTAFVAAALSTGAIPGWQFGTSGLVPFQAAQYSNCVFRFGTTGTNQVVVFQNGQNATVLQISDINSFPSANDFNHVVISQASATGQPCQIYTNGSDTNRGIQLVPNGTGTVQAPTMAPGTNSTAIATTAFVLAAATGGIKSVHIQKFTAAGAFTYTPATGLVVCIVEAVGGGGSSGGANSAAGAALGGGGGGGGSYARKLLTAAQVGSSLAGVVGVGGAPGADTTLGSTLVVAKGGAAGTTATTGSAGAGGAGGLASSSTGDVTINGGNGSAGGWFGSLGTVSVIVSGGAGGATMLSAPTFGPIAGSSSSTAGVTGSGYGGGASGAAANATGTPAGAVGATGVVIITEFCSV